MKDLIVLVADKNMEFSIKGLLNRCQSLGLRDITYDIKRHSQQDSGVFRTAHDFLRIYVNRYHYALVMLDREGCGCIESADQISRAIQTNLDNSGWSDRSKVIVLEPELEIWIWSDSPHVANIMGWQNHSTLRDWLLTEGFLHRDSSKPSNPKSAFESALKVMRKPRSSAIYRKIAERVGLGRCTDLAFNDFKQILKLWFPSGIN